MEGKILIKEPFSVFTRDISEIRPPSVPILIRTCESHSQADSAARDDKQFWFCRKSYLMFIASIKQNNDFKQGYYVREFFFSSAFIMDRGKWADTPVASKQLLNQHFVLIF